MKIIKRTPNTATNLVIIILKSAQYEDQAGIYKSGHQTQHWFQALALHNMQHLLTGVSYWCTALRVLTEFCSFLCKISSSALKNAVVPESTTTEK